MQLRRKTAAKVLRALTGKLWFFNGRILRSRPMHATRVVLASNDLTTQDIAHEVHADAYGAYIQIKPQTLEE